MTKDQQGEQVIEAGGQLLMEVQEALSTHGQWTPALTEKLSSLLVDQVAVWNRFMSEVKGDRSGAAVEAWLASHPAQEVIVEMLIQSGAADFLPRDRPVTAEDLLAAHAALEEQGGAPRDPRPLSSTEKNRARRQRRRQR